MQPLRAKTGWSLRPRVDHLDHLNTAVLHHLNGDGRSLDHLDCNLIAHGALSPTSR